MNCLYTIYPQPELVKSEIRARGYPMKETKTIPLAKQSKKNRKKYHTSQRGSWQGINPVTRMPANPKAYNRAKEKIQERLGKLKDE